MVGIGGSLAQVEYTIGSSTANPSKAEPSVELGTSGQRAKMYCSFISL